MFKLLKKIFQRKPKPILIDNTFRIIPAFEWKGETYYMHEDPMNTATGRGLTAMMFMDELAMRCTPDYLKLHIEAVDKILSDPKKIDLSNLFKLHNNLKERVNLLAIFPEHIYKMASVVFFTKDESPYQYDMKFNEKKIAEWKKTPGTYDFFLRTPLSILIPFLTLPEYNSKDYMIVVEKINKIHLESIQKVLSKSISTAVI